MNDKYTHQNNMCRPTVKIVLKAFLCLIVSSYVSAFDYVAPFTDPLQTLPKVIDSGVYLPGDTIPVFCLENANFAAPLTLSEAVDAALCNNPQIKAAWANIKVQSGALGEAKAAYLPTISGTINGMHSSTSYSNSNANTDGVTIYGNFNFRLFDFGGRSANRQATDSLLIAALANHDATLQKTLAEIIQAYFEAQTAKATFASKTQNEIIAQHTLDTAKRRETTGTGSVGDSLQATTAHARAVLEMNRAQSNYSKSLSVLIFVMGIPAQTHITLADDLYDKMSPDSKDLSEWLENAKKNHPAILAARSQLDAAKSKITATRSEGLPAIDLSVNYYQNGYPGQALSATESSSFTVGALLSIPLFDGFSRTYKIRGAEALAEQREAELRNTEHETLMELVKSYVDASAALQNVKFSEMLIQAAQAALASSQRKFDKGAADILEILNAQTAMADASQEHIRCLAELREARLRLLANAGTLGRAQLIVSSYKEVIK